MKTLTTKLLFVLLALFPSISFAQPGTTFIFAVNDTICAVLGQPITPNVTQNDKFDPFPPPAGVINVFWTDSVPCIALANNGDLSFLSNANNCCGDTLKYAYRYEGCQGPPSICVAEVTIIVKCPKPDCFFVNIEDIAVVDPDNPRCAFACENSAATFFATYNPSSTYTWTVTGGTFVPGVNAATIDITWGPMGPGAVSLAITNGGVTTTINACVVILEGPVASFTTSSTSICKNSSVTFDGSSSIGANSYFWDFGDGTTSSAQIESHTYTTPGVHTACLTVTRNNFSPDGDPLCCCTDTMCVDIVVDSLEGPKIFCVSTLCANDSTKYWTDAVCDSLKWTVLENGSPVTFTGQGNDTICVQWGAGPIGTITLEVKDCAGVYCEGPVTVNIPIIPSTVIIGGEKLVCVHATETYTVPKWMSVYYDWQVMGGTVVSGLGTNTITVHWGTAGIGMITLNYYSDFLGGLPGHDPADCMGTATLKVDIKPRFDFGPNPGVVCVNSISNFFATPFPLSTYNWTVIGAGGTPSFTGDGSDNIIVTWDAGPGTFEIKATPTDPTVYCNDVVTMIVKVVEMPKLLGIDGPTKTCPGDTYTYFAQTDQTGVNFNWSVMNGTLSSTTGNPVTVTWGASGPYELSLQQMMASAPFCSSEVFLLNVGKKTIDPFTITGHQSVCVNSVHTYSTTVQSDPDATYFWEISGPTIGSIVSGQGTPNVQVQWNDIPTTPTANLTLTVKLCSDMPQFILPVEVDDPIPPSISQGSTVCPGAPFMLTASSGYNDYDWSTLETTQSITVFAPGEYAVTVIEPNGCKSSSSFTAVGFPSPPSNPDGYIAICVSPCDLSPVTITAPTGPGPYSYAWACNGTPQATTADFLVHTNTCIVADFVYTVTLTDANSCTSISETTVSQTDVCSGSCTPEAHMLSFTTSNPAPDCNTVTFTATTVNASLIGWNFGDLTIPGGPVTPISHTYTQAGSYTVTLSAQVPNMNPPPAFCLVSVSQTVDIPLVAEFSCASSCLTATFTDESSFNLPGDMPNSWAWTFGDGGTSAMQHPSHLYTNPGTYTVTLTVMNMAGCKSTFTKTITVGGVSVDGIDINPDIVCAGTPLSFCGINELGNITQWDWKFDDGSTNGAPKPFHTYLLSGTYNVMLTVMDDDGCTDMVMVNLVVNPLPADEVITAIPGLTICEGSSTTLMVPFVLGYSYLWSDAGASTTNSITVTEAGTYSVTITDANDCTTVPEPVTVIVIPLPEATISGNHYICDKGCVMLSVPFGQNYLYLWSTGETSRTINACSASLQSPYSVTVTEPFFNCTAVSAPFDVWDAIPPVFSIGVAPDGCEGTSNTLSIMFPQPNVIYAWSNGATGTSTIVTQVGTYYAVGRDTMTGCTSTAIATINPLPDLCIVPVGCYEVCNPDTICGPSGLASYQWNKDGVPILGGTDSCLIVTQSGTYSLTGTNTFGCALTSDSLMLKVIDCTCYGLNATAVSAGTDSCCWKLSYDNPLNTLYGLVIYSDDADLYFDLSTLDASLMLDLLGPNLIGLSNSTVNTPMPGGTLSDFLTVCLSNIQNTPQQIVFDWYDANNNVLCSDTVELFAQQILEDTIFLCPGETVMLGGANYTAPDIVTVNLSGANGACDTLATYHLLPAPVHTVTITCPPNITVNVTPGSPSGIVNYPPPTATSTCVGSVPTLTQISGLPSGSAFPVGMTEVCFIAEDEDNCCSNVDTCCFKVTVTDEDPCDEQTVGCIKYELLSIVKDLAGNQTYSVRVTNNCSSKLIYAAFQVPDGITAISPANNSVYIAPSGRDYLVRNPNYSPFYSIRFKPITDSISNGESDIFEYTLPPQVCQGCILANVRVYPKIFYQAHLCCVMPSSLSGGTNGSPVVFDLLESRSETEGGLSTSTSQFAVFPNPTDGTLFADLSDWENERVQVNIFNSQGQQLQSLSVEASGMPQRIDVSNDLPDGLYFLEILTEKGVRQVARFGLHR